MSRNLIEKFVPRFAIGLAQEYVWEKDYPYSVAIFGVTTK